MTTERWPLEQGQYQDIPATVARSILYDLYKMHAIYNLVESPPCELTTEFLVGLFQELHSKLLDPMISRVRRTQRRLDKKESQAQWDGIHKDVSPTIRKVEWRSRGGVRGELERRSSVVRNDGETEYEYMGRLREAVGKNRKGLSRASLKYLRGWDG